MQSASSAATYAKEIHAGLQKMLDVRGFNLTDVFAKLAGPHIIMFLNLLYPLFSNSFMDCVKVSLQIPF